jgi:hypothetical protein
MAFAAFWSALMWRVFRIGVYVGNGGVRVKGPIRTFTIPWAQVGGIRLAPLNAPSWLSWLPLAPGIDAIWIDRRDGPPIQTLLNNQSAEFLGRRGAFGRTVASLRSELDRRRPDDSS